MLLLQPLHRVPHRLRPPVSKPSDTLGLPSKVFYPKISSFHITVEVSRAAMASHPATLLLEYCIFPVSSINYTYQKGMMAPIPEPRFMADVLVRPI